MRHHKPNSESKEVNYKGSSVTLAARDPVVDVQRLINVWGLHSLITIKIIWTRCQARPGCSFFIDIKVEICILTPPLPLADLLLTSLNKCFKILTHTPPGNISHSAANFLPSVRRDHAGLALHLSAKGKVWEPQQGECHKQTASEMKTKLQIPHQYAGRQITGTHCLYGALVISWKQHWWK